MEKDPTNLPAPPLRKIDNHRFDAPPVIMASARKSLRYALTVISTILFLFACTIAVSAQTPEPTAGDSPDVKTDLSNVKDFRPLFEERERLIAEISKLDRDIDNLQAEVLTLRPISVLKKNIEKADAVLATLNKQVTATPADEKLISDIKLEEDLKAQLNDDIVTTNTSKKTSATWLKDKEDKRRRLFSVEQKIASLFDASRDVNQFRSNATYTFGILVFIVVGGFYVIAWYKHGVAETIFAGELGMQFITLFLIVIAIILFGIMGTLEGKELAALLGGLSGYILGRAGTSKRSEAPPTDPKQNGKTQGDTQTEEPVT
jgi:hypothetical protein